MRRDAERHATEGAPNMQPLEKLSALRVGHFAAKLSKKKRPRSFLRGR